MEGDALPPFQSRSDTVVAAAGYARIDVGLRLTSSVALQAGFVAAATIPRVVVAFAGREVASWGRPVAVGFVGLQLFP